tara:strand:+ start:294 stop:488 length:195 start_codon:yes stop_codon:yes gene_type:complete
MSDFKERLEIELSELVEKTIKLEDFLASEKIHSVDFGQNDLLQIQFNAMSTYVGCLGARLKLLK